MTDDNRYNVPGLERGLAILATFTRDTPERGAPELAAMFGLPRSTVFRLLQTLESLRYLERTKDGRGYRLGIGVLRLGFEYLAAQGVVEHGRPLIARLRESTGFAAQLVVRDGRDIIYVARVAPPTVFGGTVSVGTRLPAHATVLGRVLLCDRTLAELRKLYPEKRLERCTDQTPATVDDLYALTAADRERGFAVSNGFYERTISTVAVPVYDGSNDIVAAVGLTISAQRIDAAQLRSGIVEETIGTAAELSRHLDYRGDAYQRALASAHALYSGQEAALS